VARGLLVFLQLSGEAPVVPFVREIIVVARIDQGADAMTKAYVAKPNSKIVLPRRIKPGSVLVRECKGKSHRVMVLADGFAYDGLTYTNLSEIAVLITGTRWNGPRFFGLRPKPDGGESNHSDRADVPKRKAEATARLNQSGRIGDRRPRDAGPAAKPAQAGSRHGR